eukprot:3122101-Prymnesium_polylepis.1
MLCARRVCVLQVTGASKAAATFNDAWKAKVVADTGDKYKVPSSAAGAKLVEAPAHRTISKLKIKGVIGV